MEDRSKIEENVNFVFINEEKFGHKTRIFNLSVETLIAFSGYEANKESKSGNVPIFMNPLTVAFAPQFAFRSIIYPMSPSPTSFSIIFPLTCDFGDDRETGSKEIHIIIKRHSTDHGYDPLGLMPQSMSLRKYFNVPCRFLLNVKNARFHPCWPVLMHPFHQSCQSESLSKDHIGLSSPTFRNVHSCHLVSLSLEEPSVNPALFGLYIRFKVFLLVSTKIDQMAVL